MNSVASANVLMFYDEGNTCVRKVRRWWSHEISSALEEKYGCEPLEGGGASRGVNVRDGAIWYRFFFFVFVHLYVRLGEPCWMPCTYSLVSTRASQSNSQSHCPYIFSIKAVIFNQSLISENLQDEYPPFRLINYIFIWSYFWLTF